MIPRLDVRTWVALGGMLVALIFGALWLHERDDRIRAEGELEPMLVEIDSARARATRLREASDSAVAEAKRAAARDSVVAERERAARAAAERRAAAALAAQPAAADSIVVVAATGDTVAVREAVVRYEAIVADERAAHLAVHRSDSLVILELRALAGARLDAMAALERRALAGEERADLAEAALGVALRTRPGWFERTGWKLALPAAAYLGWKAHEELSDG